MRDKSLSKVICRIINLCIYIFFLAIVIIAGLTEIYDYYELVVRFFGNYRRVIILSAALVIVSMVIVLVLKYSYKESERLFVYRVCDTLIRFICTLPVSLIISYYILIFLRFDDYIKILICCALFVFLNWLIRIGLQEAFDTSFVIDDSL